MLIKICCFNVFKEKAKKERKAKPIKAKFNTIQKQIRADPTDNWLKMIKTDPYYQLNIMIKADPNYEWFNMINTEMRGYQKKYHSIKSIRHNTDPKI